MSEMFEDLKKLSEMLEKGEITQAEYDQIKSELLAEQAAAVEPSDPMEGKPAGWYNDPSGKAQNQAYWDGTTWTGQTRSRFTDEAMGIGTATPKVAESKPIWRKTWFWLVALVGVLLIMVNLGGDLVGNEVEQVFTDIEEGLGNTPPPATSPPGGFTPFTVSGSGDDFITFSTPGDQPAALSITHNGSSNFSITSFTGSNSYIDLLVNEIGPYRGTVATNFVTGEEVGALEISADGPWTIKAVFVGDLPLRSGSASGTGDDVIRINISNAAVDLTHNGDSNFAVWVWSDSGRDLAVNEIGHYSGTIRSDTGVVIYQITANGNWTIDS